jgi:uncharacterized protein involved in exopolysaccharide biosynthesis
VANNKLPLVEPAGAYPDGYQTPVFGATTHSPSFKQRAPWYHSQRFRIFFATFLLCTTLGLIFDFSRPAVFSSSAVLLTVTPDRVGAEVDDPSLQHALIQKNLLRAKTTIDATLKRLQFEGYSQEQLPDSAQFQQMLNVVPHEATNLVEVSAEGGNADILPVLLNTLVATYAQSRSEAIAAAVNETSSALLEQQRSLEKEVAIKREELEIFRANNNILSLGRNENEVYAKLNGLTEALNTALEKRITSKAELDALQAAAAQGKTLVPPSDERAFSDLQRRQQNLRDKLTELDNKYTRDYMALHPEMKAVPEQLAAVEKQIAQKEAAGKSLVLTSASRNYQAAKNAEIALQRQLDDYKQTALAFSNSFSRHEAKKEELIQLEEHKRFVQQQITELRVEQQQQYPQIDVIEPAYLSSKPIRPYYWRDAAYIVGGSLLLGFLAIWLYEFLRRSQSQSDHYPPAPHYVTVLDPRMTTETNAVTNQNRTGNQLADETRESPGYLPNKTSTALRELDETALQDLLSAADLPTQQLIALLLSGVRPDELTTLSAESFARTGQTSEQHIVLKTSHPRMLTLNSVLQQLLEKTQGVPQWMTSTEQAQTVSFNAMLNCAAIDAGLEAPSNIDCACLHQSYICYLVRSGIKLSELRDVIGQLSPLQLTHYGQLSPPGPGLPAKEIETVHPALNVLKQLGERTRYH